MTIADWTARGRRLAAALLAMLGLVACQPVPHPFETEQKGVNPLLQLKDVVGVTVLPVTGVGPALSRQLAEAMAAALRESEIPAAVGDGNRASFVLSGAARTGPPGGPDRLLEVEWDLASADGALLGHIEQRERMPILDGPEAGAAPAPTPRVLGLARVAVAKLALLMRDEAPASKMPTAIHVGAIDGAPGDGAGSLRRAVEFVLRQSDIPVAGADHPNALTLVAAIEMGRPQDGRQRIAIRWVLLLPDGREVGDVRQENAVPAGSLDRNWGPTALLVAEAAYDGIVALYEKVPAIITP